MMFPPGFFGTRADILVDLVILSLVLFVPLLIFSYVKVKGKNYRLHRNIQIGMASVLAVVVSFFEYDIKKSGGILNLSKGGMYEGTAFLKSSFAIHLFFSGATSAVWIGLILLSLFKFANPPAPGAFSKTHRFFGRLGMIGMILTALTGIEVYIIGFAL